MSHPLKRAARREDFGEIEDLAGGPLPANGGNLPVPARPRHSFRPEEPATLARRYGARYEPVRAGNYDEFENDFDPPPYEWGSASLRHRLRDGEDYRPVRRAVDQGRDRSRHDDMERDGFFGRLSLRQSFILAGLGAVIAGGSIGLAATQIDFRGESTPAAAQEHATAALAGADQPQEVPSALASRKLILTASINVSDVSGPVDEMIPLPLRIVPERAGQKLAVRISGLPEAAYLTAGQRVAKNWILQPGQEKNVKLVVPDAEASQYQVEVAALEPTTGQLAAPAKVMTLMLEGVTAPSEAAAQPADLALVKTPAEVVEELPAAIPAPAEKPAQVASPAAELVRKGDILLKVGDLAAARQFYQEAFDQGALEGAIGAAKSYDPAVYAELNVQGLEPDRAKALDWYKKAGAAGGSDTAAAVARLSRTP